MNLNEYFCCWLTEAHLCGWITEEEIDLALTNPGCAYQLLEQCLEESVSGTAEVIQSSIKGFKDQLRIRKQNID